MTEAKQPKGEAAATWLPVDQLHAWQDNPRDNNEAVDEVAASIKRFGFGAPIIARPTDDGLEIVAGHTRFKAATRLGLDRVPVRVLDLDPTEAHLLALADNRLGELADWSDDLGDVLLELANSGAELDGLGWQNDDLEALMGAFDIAPLDGLPDLDPNESPFAQVTFTVTHAQLGTIKEAIEAAKQQGEFGDTSNTNSNGNAVDRVCQAFLDGALAK